MRATLAALGDRDRQKLRDYRCSMALDASPPVSAGSRCECGRALDVDHRFCPQCGRSHVDSGHDSRPGGPDDRVLVAGLIVEGVVGPDNGGGSTAVDGQVRKDRSRLTLWLSALAAVVVVGLMAWTIVGGGGDQTAEPPGPDEESVGDPEGPSAGKEPDVDRLQSSGGAGIDSGRSSASLVGEETGLSVVVGDEFRDLVIIDLDTGAERRLDVDGQPVGMLGDWLVVTDGGRTSRLDLTADQPELTVVEIEKPSGVGFWQPVGVVDDILTFAASPGDGPPDTVLSYDQNGELVSRHEFSLFSSGWFSPLDHELVHDAGGGIYRRIGADEYELVARGQLLAAGDDLVLVRVCDDQMACRYQWHDRATWGMIDHPAPPSATGPGQLVGGDRWLMQTDWTGGAVELVDVATGQVRQALDLAAEVWSEMPSDAFSGDGRWVVTEVGDELTVIDLERDLEWPVDVELTSLDPFESNAILVQLNEG